MTLHLVIGPVGAGKSTWARGFAAEQGAVLLVLDDFMALLFGADERPASGRLEWYLARRDRCLELIWRLVQQLSKVKTPVVLELGLLQRQEREAWYARVDAAGLTQKVWVLDAPREVRWERVDRRNREQGETFHTVVPREFFELASDLWQPPDDVERELHDVQFLPPPAAASRC